jgi:tripeptidyl-peptidase-2
MQVTSDGKPKVIDIIDCTGSGDVDCSTEVKVTVPKEMGGQTVQTLVGLSGRTLLLGNWKNPTGVYRLGIKNTGELYPRELPDRLKKLRREAFETKHHQLVTESSKESTKVEKDHVELKAEYASRTKALNEMMNSYQDPGITMDCVVFHDGEKWRVAIDKDESGDLRQAKLLTNFSDEHQYDSFGVDSMLNYSVNIYDEGQVLSIVTCAGSHGTHVAGITGAHFPEQPELDGVAPGCQLVSLKIGDTRLGSMETGQGLVRAAIEMARLKVDLANMSYGEAASLPNYGRFMDVLTNDVVNKNGTIFVTSAGNAGPALTTVGVPGSFDEVIAVGAYVTHSMMEAEYAMLDNVTERPYTWSSRGPTADGDDGVDIYAPGAAITCVPQYTIQKSQLMNGTSMASPNCCGSVALLVSALKQKGQPFTPYQVKAAIKHTGKNIGDFMQVGLIQVEKAWEYLTHALKDNLVSSLHYNVVIKDRNNARGVYLREPAETSQLQEITVQVTPKYPKHDDPTQNPTKFGMEMQLSLECSAEWISAPNYMIMASSGRGMNIRVDPTNLKPGFHYGTIAAYDTANPSLGAVFKIPVSVCKADVAQSNVVQYNNLRFRSGDIVRNFIQVPNGANFADITVSTVGRPTPARFIVHVLQLNTDTRYTTFEQEFAFSLLESGVESDTTKYTKQIPVLPGVTMELCLAQFWSSLDASTVSVEVKFHSILASLNSSTLGHYGAAGNTGTDSLLINSGNNGFSRLEIFSPLGRETVTPKVTFDTLLQSVRPTDSIVEPLQTRDVLPNSKQVHALVNSYSYKVTEGASIMFKIPRFHNVLYDSHLDNFAIMVYDTNKKLVLFQDVYGKPKKFDEGTYDIKVQFASSNLQLLNDLKASCLIVESTLATPVSPPISTSLASLDSKSKAGATVMSKGKRVVFWVGDVAAPKGAQAGDLLQGKLEFDGKIPKLFTVNYLIPPEYKPKEPETGKKEPPKDDAVVLKEAIRDLEISHVKKFKTDDGKLELLAKLVQAYPDHLPVYKEKLLVLAEKAKKGEAVDMKLCEERLNTAKTVLKILDENTVAMYFGVQNDLSKGHEADKKLNEKMTLSKEMLGLVYQTFAETYSDVIIYKETGAGLSGIADLDSLEVAAVTDLFNQSLKKFASWIPSPPVDDGNYLLLYVFQQKRLGYYATALEPVLKFLNSSKNRTKDTTVWKKVVEQKVKLLELLKWDLWKDYEEKWKVVNFPKAYARF